MTRDEYLTLDTDHPEWVYLTFDESRARFWMYDLTVVRLARAEVHWRRLTAIVFAPIIRLLDGLIAESERRAR